MRQIKWLKNSKMISNHKFKKPYESQVQDKFKEIHT